ncbi:MAG: hypothetical protein H6735_25460 [Alphaproteobacteria bacterium]|nr:hypothetical protein [Alphaproteobacteria bacterium]
MRVVVVGAGAVGQVYARHLVRGGAEVAFRVRRPDAVRRPFVIHDLNRGTAERYDAPVLGTDEEVAAFAPDVALLTVPSDALRGEWLAPFLAAIGKASVVSLEPGVDESALIRAARPDVVLAQGIIALVAYQAPLPGETRFEEPGIAVWYPWATACPFSGPGAEAFAAVLRAGGMRTTVRDDLTSDSAFGSIAFATWVTTLRAASWKFAGFSAKGPLGSAAQAQALAVASARIDRRPPWWMSLLGPRTVLATLRLGERLLPLPLEIYIQVHFTKVGAQSRMHLTEAIAHGQRLGLPVDAIEALLAAADAAPITSPGT